MQVNFLSQFADGILVGNVADHDSGAGVIIDVFRKDLIKRSLLHWLV